MEKRETHKYPNINRSEEKIKMKQLRESGNKHRQNEKRKRRGEYTEGRRDKERR